MVEARNLARAPLLVVSAVPLLALFAAINRYLTATFDKLLISPVNLMLLDDSATIAARLAALSLMDEELLVSVQLAILYAISLPDLLRYNCLVVLHAGRPFLSTSQLFVHLAAEAGFEGRLLHGHIVCVAASRAIFGLGLLLVLICLFLHSGHGRGGAISLLLDAQFGWSHFFGRLLVAHIVLSRLCLLSIRHCGKLL